MHIATFAVAFVLTQPAELLVGNKSANTVWAISLGDGRRLAEMATGKGPHEIALADSGAWAAVSNYDDHSLTVLDLRSHSVARTVGLGAHGHPHGLRVLPGDKDVVVTTESSGSVLIVDIANAAIRKTIPIGPGTGHMLTISPDGRTAWVAKISAGAVAVVDLVRGVKVTEASVGKGAEGIAVRGDELWVTNREDGTVTVHDAASLALKHKLVAPGFPIRVAFTRDGRHALVTRAKDAVLDVFDSEHKTKVASVPLSENGVVYKDTLLGKAPLPIGIAMTDSAAYVAISGGDRVAIVDTTTWKVRGHIPTGREPDALAIREQENTQ